MFLAAAAIVVLVLALTTLPVDVSGLPYLLPEVALLVWGLWLTLRRVLDVTDGRVVAITGWTGPDVGEQIHSPADYGKRIMIVNGQANNYQVRIGDRRFQIDKDIYQRTPPNSTNAAFLTPRTKRVVNIARTAT
ncbi:hypothetical protein [Amycolatopsis sp. GM8]|uniref:hypothetical protein n=1 Tax=Amycolatopsis sp. GM8 TaxID=2896530 RepID=UPI001F278A79|nr:hypothetical protein [Amycolatopsis sp. GM8]